MAKKDLSKLLKTGTLKQRLKLLDDCRANISFGKDAPLTDKEFNQLVDSFDSSEEIRLYNLHLRAYRAFREFLASAEVMHGLYKEAIAYITGFALLWDTYERSEEIINSVIAQVSDKKTKDLILKQFANRSHFLYTDIDVDKEGFLRFHTDNRNHKKKGKPRGEDYSIEGILDLWKGKAEEYARHTKTFVKVLMDYMEETDYKPSAFHDRLLTLLADVEEDHALLPKFSKQRITQIEHSNFELLAKYFVYPDPENMEVPEDDYDRLALSLRNIVNNA